MIVGSAEILVLPVVKGFDSELKKQLTPGLDKAAKDAEAGGVQIGGGIRKGVGRETGKLAGDLEKDGAKAGEGLHRGMSGGLSKLAGLIGATGLPLEHLSTGLEKAGTAAEHAGSKSSGLVGTLDRVGKVALIGAAAGFAGLAAEGVHLGESMQTAEASIASASGTSIKAATAIGNAFLDTGGKTEFTAQEMAQAYASVAGELKTTEGHALSTAQAMEVMSAADDLATAKKLDLGAATKDVAGIMQAFQLPTSQAAHVTDVLYGASTATGQSVDQLTNSLQRARSKMGESAGSVSDLAGLLVDMTKQGITGRTSLMALNTALNTVQKSATGVQQAVQLQKTAFQSMTPQMQQLVTSYENGSLSQKDFTKATKDLTPEQAALVQEYTKATTAIDTANLKYKELGVRVFDARGAFVGMGSIIDQLHPKFATMTYQQQLAAASTLFGAGAARQMVAVINAGPAAYDAATQSVAKHGQAQQAAAQQAKTLHVEEQTLGAEISDLTTKFGVLLIPIITTAVGWFIKATTFVTDHKAALIALGAVVTGILGPAIAVFTINKMASFVGSFQQASSHVKSFASDVESVVTRITTAFGKQNTAADGMAKNVAGNATTASGAVATEATDIEASTTAIDGSIASTSAASEAAAGKIEAANTQAGASFGAEATDAGSAATAIGAAETAMVAEVSAADTAIEGDNAVAGASFAGLVSAAAPFLAIGAGGLALAESGAGNPLAFKKGEHPVGYTVAGNNAQGGFTGGGRMSGLSGFGATGGGGALSSTASTLGITLPSGNFAAPLPQHHTAKASDVIRPQIETLKPKIAKAKDVIARAASGNLTKSQLEQLWIQAGGNPADANIAASIALAESSGNPNAAGDVGLGGPGPTSFGLWQIHTPAHPQYSASRLMSDPLYNARAAVAVSNNGGSFTPWSTFTSGAYRQYLGVPASAGGLPVPGVTTAPTGASYVQAAQAAQLTPAQRLAQEKAALPGMIAQEKGQVAAEIAKLKAELAPTKTATLDAKGHWKTHSTPASPEMRAQVAGEIAALKAALQVQIAQQKTALGEQVAATKAELSRQTSDVKAGASELDKLLTAVHTGTLSSLKSALWQAHLSGLSSLEKRLDHDHSSALAQLSKELVKVHQQAMADYVKQAKAAQQATEEKTLTAALTKAASDSTRTATDAAKLIADQTKITLDKQAEVGLTNEALIAAQSQTAYDTIVQQNDQAIAAAQQKVDNAASGTPLQQAIAAKQLADAQAVATIQEAQQQSVLDLANAAAQAAQRSAPTTGSSSASPTSPGAPASSPSGPAPNINITINGSGLSPSSLLSEISWAIHTGALPVAT